MNWLFNATIIDTSVTYVTAYRCAGGLKKKVILKMNIFILTSLVMHAPDLIKIHFRNVFGFYAVHILFSILTHSTFDLEILSSRMGCFKKTVTIKGSCHNGLFSLSTVQYLEPVVQRTALIQYCHQTSWP